MKTEETDNEKGRSASYRATQRQIEAMRAKGLYRRIMQIDPETYEIISDFREDLGYEMNSDLMAFLVDSHRNIGKDRSEDKIIEGVVGAGKTSQGFTVFLSDSDFDYLKDVARRNGLRRSAVKGMAVVVRDLEGSDLASE